MNEREKLVKWIEAAKLVYPLCQNKDVFWERVSDQYRKLWDMDSERYLQSLPRKSEPLLSPGREAEVVVVSQLQRGGDGEVSCPIQGSDALAEK